MRTEIAKMYFRNRFKDKETNIFQDITEADKQKTKETF